MQYTKEHDAPVLSITTHIHKSSRLNSTFLIPTLRSGLDTVCSNVLPPGSPWKWAGGGGGGGYVAGDVQSMTHDAATSYPVFFLGENWRICDSLLVYQTSKNLVKIGNL